MGMGPGHLRNIRRDSFLAIGLALLMGIAWTVRDHGALGALRLPDTDDLMRLQQIRDWLGGQAFTDLAQHRLGPAPGLQMHWSRLADLVPAALILAFTPLLGGHAAGVVAVVVSPLLLFAAMLIVVAAIARRLGQSGFVAVILGALAFPAITLFTPGRIDHHALQIVLVLSLLHACVGRGTLLQGAIAGTATVLSLVVGMETAPLLAVGGAAIALRWRLDGAAGQARMAGYATALLLGLSAAAVLFRSSGWNVAACDGFTAILWRAAMLAALAPAGMAVAGFATQSVAARTAVLIVAGGLALVGAAASAPACLHPYGQVDPLLARLWLAHVNEAQPLFAMPLGKAVAAGGMALVGLGAGIWFAWTTRTAAAWILLGFQATAVAVTLVQVRGAPLAALTAVPALAAMIAAARPRGPLALVLAWLAASGIAHAGLGDALTPAAPASATHGCTAVATAVRLAALPPGLVAAPIDFGPTLLATTRHRVLAGPYHRDTQGNRAMYDLFLSPTPQAEALARRWGVDYVALCKDGFAELGDRTKDRQLLAGSLMAGQVPPWLRQISAPGASTRVYTLTQPARRTTQ
ncbi:hypothetical protein SAMN03159338_2380 [Sphingomonas sp. NFR04]|uniref:hypothetical protein n=1 Tax=Sphingomonas sp. NFR04 TaxID=1566283 RepID=UPI0008E080AC|nr:hypothetical protein [Sphingomonas sp. NFR04]SFJ80419.1 hypothetical protein SAMN03159338_2380 [Sphingomonas sp. NFR04]